MSLPFDDIKSTENNLFFILTPYSCDKKFIYEEILKYSELIRNNHRLITVDKTDNPEQINYEEFAKYQSEQYNKFFIIDNVHFFMYYNIETYNKSNILIFLINALDIEKIPFIYNRNRYKAISLYPRNFCNKLEFEYKVLKTYITGDQLTTYKKEYLKYISNPSLIRDKTINEGINNPANYLNVYYDKIIPSLEQTSLEQALSRSPKFKTILLEILTKNKKRHLIHLPDNKHGIDAFSIIYNKLNTNAPLIVIKSLDDYDLKRKRLNEFNKNNSPAVLLTDYYFVGSNVPKNISVYHITDGGKDQDLISILEYAKIINRNITKEINFEIINHLASTIKGELTIDEINSISFKEKYIKYTSDYEILKNKSGKLFLEGSDLKIELP